MFQRALICTDLTDGLHRLVNFVPSLAAGGFRQVVFLHTLAIPEDQIPRQDDTKVEKVRDRFKSALKNVPSDVDVKIEVSYGKPIDHIIGAIKTYQSDVVLLGTPGRSLLQEKLFGSTTIGLCQRVNIPLLILRPQLVSTYTNEELDLRCRHLFRYLLIPFDGSDAGNHLVRQIKSYAAKHQPNTFEECFICWVVDDVSREPQLRQHEFEEAEKKLAALKPEFEALGLKVDAQVLQGNPVTQILAAAVDYDISAIATSSRSVGKLIELSVPSLTGEILRRSWHPILYFPPEGR